MPRSISLEICVDSIDSAVAAERGGADRIELCSSLGEGGLTPSSGLISVVRNKVKLDIFVMVRPRAGDFYYSDDEFAAMQQDVLTAKQLGVDGVVTGILKIDGRIDVERTRVLVELARPMQVTFHRAFDVSRDLNESLEAVISAGADRVLTSGGKANVELGKSKIAELVRQANGRVIVMAGSGVSEANCRQIATETGITEIHASLRTAAPSPMQHQNRKILFRDRRDGGEFDRSITGEQRVQAVARALEEPRINSVQAINTE